jgi:hypothetical protein
MIQIYSLSQSTRRSGGPDPALKIGHIQTKRRSGPPLQGLGIDLQKVIGLRQRVAEAM